GVLIPMLPAGALILGMVLWPWIERGVSGDNREHHILDRPRNAPGRTAAGVAGVIFYSVMWLAASSDLIAVYFKMSLHDVVYVLRGLVILGPRLGVIIAKRLGLDLLRGEGER